MGPDHWPARAKAWEHVMIRFLTFDLDDTLYPAGSGMFHEVGRRIDLYLREQVGLSWDDVRHLRRLYLERYGTTLRGLQLHHDVDAEDYLLFVHDVDVASYLQPFPALDTVLSSLPQEKILFTNASTEYALRVLDVLGVRAHFSRLFDIHALRFHCKPDPEAYRILLEALPARGPECLLIEDNPRNLRAGKAAGMHTLMVGPKAVTGNGVDFAGQSVLQVAEAVRALSLNQSERSAQPGGEAGQDG